MNCYKMKIKINVNLKECNFTYRYAGVSRSPLKHLSILNTNAVKLQGVKSEFVFGNSYIFNQTSQLPPLQTPNI